VKSGEQAIFEAIVRSLPARAELEAMREFVVRMTAIAKPFSESLERMGKQFERVARDFARANQRHNDALRKIGRPR
jgi:hypothetical protein